VLVFRRIPKKKVQNSMKCSVPRLRFFSLPACMLALAISGLSLSYDLAHSETRDQCLNKCEVSAGETLEQCLEDYGFNSDGSRNDGAQTSVNDTPCSGIADVRANECVAGCPQ
jgi:hypothetical protein